MHIGCDLVHIPRLEKMLAKEPGLRGRLFTQAEQKNDSLEHLAGVFAAKEATMKALGVKVGEWHNIEVINEESGKPQIKILVGEHAGQISVSISHDGEYAMAVVLAE